MKNSGKNWDTSDAKSAECFLREKAICALFAKQRINAVDNLIFCLNGTIYRLFAIIPYFNKCLNTILINFAVILFTGTHSLKSCFRIVSESCLSGITLYSFPRRRRALVSESRSCHPALFFSGCITPSLVSGSLFSSFRT